MHECGTACLFGLVMVAGLIHLERRLFQLVALPFATLLPLILVGLAIDLPLHLFLSMCVICGSFAIHIHCRDLVILLCAPAPVVFCVIEGLQRGSGHLLFFWSWSE